MNIEKTVKNLELRGFAVKHFETGAQAAEYLKDACAGQTVGFGGKEYCAVPKNGDTAITFTVKTGAGGILTLEPHWGAHDEGANMLDGIIEDVGTENN